MLALLASTALLTACTENLPHSPKATFSAPQRVSSKFNSVNRNREAPITYIKLDKDVLRPMRQLKERLPSDRWVGPFEMREETLAGALELILADQHIPMAFQTSKVMTNTVTVTGLQGPVNDVVDRVCALANLYCSYEAGTLVVKETETFTVSLPPMIADDYTPFVSGIKAITGGQTYVDGLTRSLIYTTSQRNHQRAQQYFERLRANTAMIVYEIQIWEVQLSDQNQTGIDWEQLSGQIGNFDFNLTRDGAPSIAGAIGIGAQYTSADLTADAVLSFLQTQGAVKTVSQPQLTMLSGSNARLRVGNSRDYVSQITRTVGVNTADNVSVATSKLETGLNLEINSAWDSGTVYGRLKIDLLNLIRLGSLDVGTTSIQLPETSDRSLETKLRVRPGDAVLIGGIVEERNSLDQQGVPGGKKPLFATSKDKSAANTELVFMLRPRVVVYTDKPPHDAQLHETPLYQESFRPNEEQITLPPPVPSEKRFMPKANIKPLVTTPTLPVKTQPVTQKPVAASAKPVTQPAARPVIKQTELKAPVKAAPQPVKPQTKAETAKPQSGKTDSAAKPASATANASQSTSPVLKN